jgi:very-short-patch-repair endonuclease
MTEESKISIREHYNFLNQEIVEANKKHGIKKWVYPYGDWPWMPMFSPIEQITWDLLRFFGHCPMYPQYPVGPYFLDFGNPIVKVAIECDGKEFHQDKARDKKRDEYLFEQGYRVYRINGTDCNRQKDENFYKDIESDLFITRHSAFTKFYMQTLEGLIKALAICYFSDKDFADGEMLYVVDCLNKRMSLRDKYIHELERKLVER